MYHRTYSFVVSVLALLCVCSIALSAPLLPHVVHGSINLRPYGCIAAHHITVWNDLVYMSGAATSGAGPTVWIIDPSNPNSLSYITGVGDGYKAYGLTAWEDKLYVANWSTNLRIYDVAGSTPSLLGSNWISGEFGWDLCTWANYCYLGEGSETQSRIHIFDVSSPSSPTILSTLEDYKLGGPAVRGSSMYCVAHNTFRVVNISDADNPYTMASLTLRSGLGTVQLRDNHAYVGWNNVTEGGFYVIDISNPTSPQQVGSYYNNCAGGTVHLMGDCAFYGTSGNGFLTVDISDPTDPTLIAQTDMPVYALELAVAGNGRYVYVGTLQGDNEGALYAVEAFTSDPDSAGPSTYEGFYPRQTSHDTQYEAYALPTASSPAWTVIEGTESLASAGGGVLRINDDSGSAKLKYIRDWNATNTNGATVCARARCASYDLNGGSQSTIGNIFIEDGKYKEDFTILTNKIRAVNANMEYSLDGTQWHTYRITTQGSQFKVYVDENSTAVMTGTLSSTTNRARVWFGSGSTQCKQDIYFDYVYAFSGGARGPSETTTDITPDVEADVADVAGKDSLSGILGSTARVLWSTDGGNSWSSDGWECQYEGNALPASSTPAWTVDEGSQSYASISSGLLRVNDNSTASGSKIKWSRDWNAWPSIGTTVVARARCASTGGDTTYLGNIFVEDGSRTQWLKIMTDRVVAAGTSQTYMLDGTQWHTYRLCTAGTSYWLYVDENTTPVLTGTMTSTASTNRVIFGSGASAGTQDIYFDWVYYSTNGAFAPNTGGASASVAFTPANGDDRGHIEAYSVPFNQYSDYLNRVCFSMRDKVGNLGTSPIYVVRTVSPGAPGSVTSFAADSGDGEVDLGWHNPSDSQFTGTMVRYRTDTYPTSATDGTLLCDRSASPGSDDGFTHSGVTNGVTYFYAAFAHDYVPNYATSATDSCVPRDVTAPGPVTSFAATSGDTQIQLGWANPGDSDFAGTRVVFKTTGYPIGPTDGTIAYEGTGTSHNHTGLTNGVTYYYRAYARDEVPNWSTAAQSSAVPADVTAPGPVTTFAVTPGSQVNHLSWANPDASDFAGVKIMFKTTGYPTGPADGAQCYSGTGTSCDHASLTNGVTYYYAAYAFDEVPNYSTAATDDGTPFSQLVTLNVKQAGSITVNGSSGDWNLAGFTSTVRAGQGGTGDIALVGFDGGQLYYNGYWTGGVLPTSAADHTAKVYSRHNGGYLYFLVRCEDSDMRYSNPASANWANDCVEFYIDPGHNHGSSALSNSTSDIQLVIDANNQKNVYMCTSGYASQVLAGVTSAVARDATGWWLEVAIDKSVLDPDLGASATVGVDFSFRDNDNDNDPTQTTVYSWSDPTRNAGFPSKVPDNWGDGSLVTLTQSSYTGGPYAIPGTIQAENYDNGGEYVSYHDASYGNDGGQYRTDDVDIQSTSDTGGGYSVGWTDSGEWMEYTVSIATAGKYDIKLRVASPNTGGTFHVEMNGANVTGTQSVPNTGDWQTWTTVIVPAVQLSAGQQVMRVVVDTGGWNFNYVEVARSILTISNSTFNSNADGWSIATWKSGPYDPGTMAWNSGAGSSGSGMRCGGSGATDNTDRCNREGGEIYKTISTAGYSNIQLSYDLRVNSLGQSRTGTGSGTCAVDHNLIDEQLTVFYSTNGGTNWTEANYITRSTLLGYTAYGTRTIDLTGVSAANNNANFALRFRWQVNSTADTADLDNIKVMGNQ